MDFYMEYMVKRKFKLFDYLISIACIVLGVLIIYFTLPFFFVPAISGIYALLVAGIIYLVCLLIKRKSLEFEYILTNNELDIDKISGQSVRKRVCQLNFASIDICAAADDTYHKAEFQNTSSISKVMDFTDGTNEGVYFIDYTDEKGRMRVLFQPPKKMLENVLRYNPHKIFIK